MRFLVSILLMCLVTAMTVPTFASVKTYFADRTMETECMMGSCGNEPQSHGKDSSDKHNCCDKMACDNPFTACACCFACFFDDISSPKKYSFTDRKTYLLSDAALQSRYIEGDFQPPEIV